jgi:adenosylmethionine-8-amino-7-oxononanoate aminotransferase
LFSSRPAEALAERLADLAPIADARVFFTPGGGSDAIDTAAKLARAYWHAIDRPQKQLIIARQHAYHGMNAYGTSLGGIPANTDPFGPLVTLVEHVAWDDAHALAKVIDQVGADRVAAFFCEPVIGAGGVYFPPDGYLSEVQQICREKDVLLVADEVIIGFGRTEPSRRQERAFRRSQLVRWTRVRSWLQPLTTALTPAVSSGRFPRTGRTDLVAGFIYVLAGVPIAIVVRMVDT